MSVKLSTERHTPEERGPDQANSCGMRIQQTDTFRHWIDYSEALH